MPEPAAAEPDATSAPEPAVAEPDDAPGSAAAEPDDVRGSAAAEPESDPDDASGSAAAEPAPGPAPTGDGGLFAELLRKARGPWLPWTGPLTFESARRIACDCVLTPIVLDDNDAPLNLGRTQRLVSRKLRRAVLARDHGCAFPGCGRPAEWCQVHHAVHVRREARDYRTGVKDPRFPTVTAVG